MSKKKNQVGVVIECKPDHQVRHKYHGTITFRDSTRSINAPFTFTALMTGKDFHFEFFLRDNSLFQFHEDQPIDEQLTNAEAERTFRCALIQIALGGVEGSGKMAEMFYDEAEPSDDDVYAQLASLIQYRYECDLNLKEEKREVRDKILRRLQEAS